MLPNRISQKILTSVTTALKAPRALKSYLRYRRFTMIQPDVYITNLLLCANKAPASGCIVEAGVWRGGMSAGMADMLPGRVHYLFDSFEGLPAAKAIDGEKALEWQRNVNAPGYYDNCRAERSFAEEAMRTARVRRCHFIEGWFSNTIPDFIPEEPIAILRLDGDWYESTMECLAGLYPHVVAGGLVILDDYYTWDGCALALHDYLSEHKLADRVEQWNGVCYLIKRGANDWSAA
jgi:O-methyltransferase